MAHLLGIAILNIADGMPTPAHHQIRFDVGAQYARIAQDLEHRIDVARLQAGFVIAS